MGHLSISIPQYLSISSSSGKIHDHFLFHRFVFVFFFKDEGYRWILISGYFKDQGSGYRWS